MYNIDEIPDTIGRLDKINLVCPTHGSFTITVRSLMKGQGCTKCGWARGAAKNRHTLEDFVTAAKAAHGNTYEYNNVEYVNSSAEVAITCRTHGDFYMTPASHISDRQGCPKCAHTGPSKQEQSVCEFLDGLGIDYLQTDRRVIKPKELDIVIPSKNIAIEYNGLRWHSTQFLRDNTYHRNKSRLCEAAGYRLIHIWEDDWIFRQEHIKNMLTGALCNIRAVYGRHTKLREIDRITAEAFMVKNHIQGATNSTERYGLFHNGELVSVATFLRNRSWYLNRCATKHGLRVIGSLGKFTKNFVKRHRGEQLISFCDISMYSGQSYLSAGFTVDSILPPDYKYVVNNQRIHKFNFRRKHLRKFLGSRFEPSLSEVQNMERAGYYRVFDCGKIRFVLK
jgi:G:T-mismatch repair DNA endonuclease (very short patch repair protein)